MNSVDPSVDPAIQAARGLFQGARSLRDSLARREFESASYWSAECQRRMCQLRSLSKLEGDARRWAGLAERALTRCHSRVKDEQDRVGQELEELQGRADQAARYRSA